MEKLFILFVFALAPFSAHAMDHRSQFGVGGALGGNFPSPLARSEFRSQVTPKFPAASFWLRYIPGTPEVGTELSFNHIGLATTNIRSNSMIFSFISRQNPWGNFHPFYAFGMGYAKNENFFGTGDYESGIFKLTAGIEFEVNEQMDWGFYLHHYSIFKNARDGEEHVHVLSPVLALNYYFGTPAPIPPPPPPAGAPPVKAVSPAPAPAPAASTPAAAPTVESHPSEHVKKAPPAKQKAKAKPKAKDAPKKKKKPSR